MSKSILKPMDVVVSFDTTGSMYSVLSQVRQNVVKFVGRMFDVSDDIRMGIICHGDYCDKNNPYTIRVMDLTDDVKKLEKFIVDTQSTYGGDADECYELVLNVANNEMSWGEGREKVLIVIGDANPHGTGYSLNTKHLDWEKEAYDLAAAGVKVFGVHALANYRNGSKRFYESISKITGGVYLTLDNFNEIFDIVVMTAMSQQEDMEERLNDYVTIIRNNGRMTKTLAKNLDRLTGKTSKFTEELHKISRPGLVPVPSGRFQTMRVTVGCSIRDFINSNGITFKVGRGFYELTKHETVQQYKEIIIQDRETGEMFNGDQVREYLNLKPQVEKGGAKESLSSRDIREFRVFVQSTSYNRKLVAGTTLLYEVEDFIESAAVTPVTPEVPVVPVAPVAPESKTPKAPVVPVVPEVPEVPESKTPVVPVVPEVPESKTPVVPVVPEVPESKTPKTPADTKATKSKTKKVKDETPKSKPKTRKTKETKLNWGDINAKIDEAITDCNRVFDILDKKPTRNDLASFIRHYAFSLFKSDLTKFEIMMAYVRSSSESLKVISKTSDRMSNSDYIEFITGKVK